MYFLFYLLNVNNFFLFLEYQLDFIFLMWRIEWERKNPFNSLSRHFLLLLLFFFLKLSFPRLYGKWENDERIEIRATPGAKFFPSWTLLHSVVYRLRNMSRFSDGLCKTTIFHVTAITRIKAHSSRRCLEILILDNSFLFIWDWK